MTTPLILASQSPYRRELLQRLRLPFDAVRPDVDESPRPGETPAALALRLAQDKAAHVAARLPQAWVIGSDQVADLDGVPIGKPRDRDDACRQLAAASGRSVVFHTALALRHAGDDVAWTAADRTRVRFRTLDAATIERYIDAESPLDCAGSFKCEGLGIALFEAIETTDPTALVGLPLIALSALLRRARFAVP